MELKLLTNIRTGNFRNLADDELRPVLEAQARLTLQQIHAWGLETCPHDYGDVTRCYRHACGACGGELGIRKYPNYKCLLCTRFQEDKGKSFCDLSLNPLMCGRLFNPKGGTAVPA